jgi:hypothetical protein
VDDNVFVIEGNHVLAHACALPFRLDHCYVRTPSEIGDPLGLNIREIRHGCVVPALTPL